MKRIILILLTTLTLSSNVHAEDISYYRIDGMKVGDSLLDYLSEKEILEYFAKDFQEFIQISMPGKKFDIIAINYLRNCPKFYDSTEFSTSGSKTNRLLPILKDLGSKEYLTGPSASSYLDLELLKALLLSLTTMMFSMIN